MPTLGFDRQSFSHGIDSFFFSFFFLVVAHRTARAVHASLFLFTTASHRVKLRKWEVAVSPHRTYGTHFLLPLHARAPLVDGRTDTTQDVRSVRGVLVPHTWSTLFSSTFRLTMSWDSTMCLALHFSSISICSAHAFPLT
jgi:hypothetical protein